MIFLLHTIQLWGLRLLLFAGSPPTAPVPPPPPPRPHKWGKGEKKGKKDGRWRRLSWRWPWRRARGAGASARRWSRGCPGRCGCALLRCGVHVRCLVGGWWLVDGIQEGAHTRRRTPLPRIHIHIDTHTTPPSARSPSTNVVSSQPCTPKMSMCGKVTLNPPKSTRAVLNCTSFRRPFPPPPAPPAAGCPLPAPPAPAPPKGCLGVRKMPFSSTLVRMPRRPCVLGCCCWKWCVCVLVVGDGGDGG